MSKNHDVCLDYSLGADAVGEKVYIVLLPDFAGKATSNGTVLATVSFFEKIQGKLTEQVQKAWDVCTKKWVNQTTYDYHYDYCYTLTYEDAETSPPGQAIAKDEVSAYIALDDLGTFLADSEIIQEPDGDIVYRSPIGTKTTAKLLSAQAGNVLQVGSDKGAYLSPAMILAHSVAQVNFTFSADSGSTQTVNTGNNITFIGGDGILAVAHGPDKLTIAAQLSGQAGNILQIVNGELYATLPGAGGTDSLVVDSINPAGTNRMHHTAIDGTDTFFHTGFQLVEANTGCGSANAGVASNKMVRSVRVANQQLIVEAAPEHSFATASSFYSAAILQDISVAGFTYDHGPTPPIVIPNLNLCRQVNLRYFVDCYLQLECYPLGIWRHNGVIDIGAGPVVVGGGRYGTYSGLTGIPAFHHFSGITTIAPAATRILTAAQQLVVEANSSGGVSRIVQGSVNLGYVGGTA